MAFLACECNEEGSVGIECDENSGKCTCKENVIGDKCTQCATEFWGFSDCQGMKTIFISVIRVVEILSVSGEI